MRKLRKENTNVIYLKDLVKMVAEKTELPVYEVKKVMKEGFLFLAEETFIKGKRVVIREAMSFNTFPVSSHVIKNSFLNGKDHIVPLHYKVVVRRGGKFKKK